MRRHVVIALLTCHLFGPFPTVGILGDPVRFEPVVAEGFPPQSPVSPRLELLNPNRNSAGHVWSQVVSLMAECKRVVVTNGSLWSGNRPGTGLLTIADGGDFEVGLFAITNRSDVVEFASDLDASNVLKAGLQTTETTLVAGPSVIVDPAVFTRARLLS